MKKYTVKSKNSGLFCFGWTVDLFIILSVILSFSTNKGNCVVRSSFNDTHSRNFTDQKNPITKHRIRPPQSCTFDRDFCGWHHDIHAQFTWTRRKGRTPSGQTGPLWDHTTKDANRGYYIYLETSSPRKKGDVARLISPTVSKRGTYCLSFWHHMHGVGVEQMNVYKQNI